MISLMIVEDHELVRTALRFMLSNRTNLPGITVIGEASSGEQAIQRVKANKPDIVLLDIELPGISGLETANRLLRNDSKIKIIVLSAHSYNPLPSNLFKIGIKGYLTKGASSDEMLKAINSVAAGKMYLEQKLAQQVALTSGSACDISPFDILSARELEIMLKIVNGNRVPDIASNLCVSPKTINTYRYRLFEKLNVNSDVELTLFAIRYGLLKQSNE